MAYIKNNWVDQDVERPKTYEVTNNQDGSITLTDSFGVVTEIGTPVNAVNMNHIEDGIANNDTAITALEDLKADKVQLHALKGYLDNGTLLTDSEGLNDVKYYAHSTFDLSKFTVVGSPNITDDGIASGFSSSYLTFTNYLSNASSFKFNLRFKIGDAQEHYVGIPGQGWGGFINRWWGDLSIYLGVDSNDTPINISIPGSVGSGSWFTLKIIYANGVYSSTLLNEETGIITQSSPITAGISELLSSAQLLYLGINADHPDSFPLSNGSIDLKQFSITVDGVEVFSGNKTGIDTIKPDDYTVVGTPVITSDGILNQATSSNCVTTNTLTLSNDNDIDIEMKVYLLGNHCYVFGGSNATRFEPYNIPANGNPAWSALSFAEQFAMAIIEVLPENQWTTIRLHYRGANSYAEILENGNFRSLSTFIIANNSFSINEILSIGQFNGNSSNCNIDLNAFKIYVDGNLVYQPCLKIPYTESKTGSKIVSSPYRDRVADMSAQFGYAPYYTLSDTDFTLPMGELYGMYEKYRKQTLIDMMPDYANGITITSGFAAPSIGWISLNCWSATAGTDTNVYINGIKITGIGTAGGDVSNATQIPVNKGDVITYNNGGYTSLFFPMKGAN